ncbi:MAG: hypothetical protein ABI835_04435 [Chloroflexota bacterium]
MNPLARLKQLRKALRLYDALARGDTALLLDYFPFVKAVFTPKILPPKIPQPLRKPLEPPKITYRARSDEEDLRDALDIGFGELKFDPLEKDDS